MKKENTTAVTKEAHSTEKKSIKESLIKELKAFAAKLGHTSKKIDKEIEKAAKQLAKRLAKPAKAEKTAAPKPAKKAAPQVAKTPKLVAVDKAPALPATPKPVKKEVA